MSPYYPADVTDAIVSGPRCPECRAVDGCGCNPDEDPRSYRERIDEEMGEEKFELERCENL
jgi:hypothetical protein